MNTARSDDRPQPVPSAGELPTRKPSSQAAFKVLSIQVGRVAPLSGNVQSGFVKSLVQGEIQAGVLGLSGDEQADLTVHGGPDKAVYCYPFEHYARWAHDYPRHKPMLIGGGFGENLTTLGLNEETVSIGQIFRVGTAELQVTQPRQPCFKLAIRFDDGTLGRAMMRTGRTGWYVRIIKPGALRAGDQIHILHTPNPSWTIARFNTLLLNRAGSTRKRDELAELAALEGLAEGWKRRAQEALDDQDNSKDA
jgi:MOSC domain-containing protein YiiM